MTDDIQKVREAYDAALREVTGCGIGSSLDAELFAALAKRLQPRPEPVKKVWSVSVETGGKFAQTKGEMTPWSEHLNRFAPDIIRERPDLVAAEWERRVRERARRLGVRVVESMTAFDRCDLFPELDQRHP